MRRSIKILAGIVVLFLLLVIVSAAMSGNNSSTSTATATPAADNSSGHDALLSAVAAQAAKDNGGNGETWTTSWNEDRSLHVDVSWVDSSGAIRGIHADITNAGTAANATALYNGSLNGTGAISDTHETSFMEIECAAALGHTPTVVKDMSWHYAAYNGPDGNYPAEQAAAHEAIVYDNLFIHISQNLGLTGDAGPGTPQ